MVYWFHRFHKWMKRGCVLCVSSSDFVVHVEHDVLTMRKAVFRSFGVFCNVEDAFEGV